MGRKARPAWPTAACVTLLQRLAGGPTPQNKGHREFCLNIRQVQPVACKSLAPLADAFEPTFESKSNVWDVGAPFNDWHEACDISGNGLPGRIGVLGEAQDGYTKELMAAIPRFAAGILETTSRDE